MAHSHWLVNVSLEGLMLKLKLQYFGHLMQRTDSFEKILMLGKRAGGEGDNRGWDGWMSSVTQQIWVWINSGSWWWTEKPDVLQSMGSQRVGMTERLKDWTELNWTDWTELNLVSVSVSLMTQRTQGICWRIHMLHPRANTKVRNDSPGNLNQPTMYEFV